jgi:hypothetical protein
VIEAFSDESWNLLFVRVVADISGGEAAVLSEAWMSRHVPVTVVPSLLTMRILKAIVAFKPALLSRQRI